MKGKDKRPESTMEVKTPRNREKRIALEAKMGPTALVGKEVEVHMPSNVAVPVEPAPHAIIGHNKPPPENVTTAKKRHPSEQSHTHDEGKRGDTGKMEPRDT
jgi:hypothetical protein